MFLGPSNLDDFGFENLTAVTGTFLISHPMRKVGPLANVVGMVASTRQNRVESEKFSKGPNNESFGKLFFNFPDERECEALYYFKILMLDGCVVDRLYQVYYLLAQLFFVTDLGNQSKWVGQNQLLHLGS